MSYTVLSRSWIKARKPHKCVLCAEIISIGEVYYHENGIFDGIFQEVKLHSICRDIVGEYIDDYLESGMSFTYDEVWDWYCEKERDDELHHCKYEL